MTRIIVTTIFVFALNFLLAHTNGHECNHFTHSIRNNGIGLGAAIAVVISWSRNKSILWAIIHGALSWLYVIYYYLKLKDQE